MTNANIKTAANAQTTNGASHESSPVTTQNTPLEAATKLETRKPTVNQNLIFRSNSFTLQTALFALPQVSHQLCVAYYISKMVFFMGFFSDFFLVFL